MKLYTIIGGVNGCRKSSLTGALKAERDDLGIIIDPDKYAVQMGGYGAVGRAVIQKTDQCLEKGLNFTQETILSGALWSAATGAALLRPGPLFRQRQRLCGGGPL